MSSLAVYSTEQSRCYAIMMDEEGVVVIPAGEAGGGGGGFKSDVATPAIESNAFAYIVTLSLGCCC